MKKMMFTLAMVMGLGTTVAFAGNAQTQTTDAANSTVLALTADEFTPIELTELPQAILYGIANNFPGKTAKDAAASTDEATKTSIYKITLIDENGNEQTALFSDKGEVINPTTAASTEETAETEDTGE